MNLDRLTKRRNNATAFADWLKFQRMIDYLWSIAIIKEEGCLIRISPPSKVTKSADILIFENVKRDLECPEETRNEKQNSHT